MIFDLMMVLLCSFSVFCLIVWHAAPTTTTTISIIRGEERERIECVWTQFCSHRRIPLVLKISDKQTHYAYICSNRKINEVGMLKVNMLMMMRAWTIKAKAAN